MPSTRSKAIHPVLKSPPPKSKGQSLIEYALACGVLAVAALAGFNYLKPSVIVPELVGSQMGEATKKGDTLELRPVGKA
jgi:hypothetical protein